jgi:hypothetical protein
MSRFQQKVLDPLIRNANLEIDAALGMETIAEKTRGLLAARETNEAAFSRAARRQIYKVAGSVLLIGAGASAAIVGIMAATSIFAIIAGTTGMSIPVAVAGAVAFIAGVFSFTVVWANYNRVKKAWKSLRNKIDEAVPG